jgi:predicted dehydrogenase
MPPGLLWKILFEKGQISVEAPAPTIQWSYENDTVTIKKFDNATGQTEKIEIAEMELEDIKTPARMIGRIYEAFASGGQYQTFEDALQHHRRLDRIAKGALHLEKNA